MAANQGSEKKVSFKDTLNLPRTDFPIRANAKKGDPAMLERWEQEALDLKSFDVNKGKKTFILHDGPPYANGHIHVGHAYNKVLKDIIAKSQRMFGRHVPVTPGWDCHGLPIELKVTQENPELKGAALKKACRLYAAKWIDVQREEFKALGVLMDWNRPYLTMNYAYEASILQAFGMFVAGGYIERKNKTVPWCFSCETVLASAEIEYEDRKDPSIYVEFPLQQSVVDTVLPELKGKEVSLLIWTTTPWTLPLNRAVILKPKTEYVVLEINGKNVIVGKALADALCLAMGVEKKVIAEFTSDALAHHKPLAHHPFVEGLMVPVILDEMVELGDGTACVHSAPGCGPEDYEIGIKNKLDIYSPLSPNGRYTSKIEPKELEDMSINDGQIWVLKKLVEKGRLLYKTSIRHPYPHCWRCRNGLMYRATKQWFCDLSRDNLKQRALDAIDTIRTIPEKSFSRLKATVEGRLEWCLSRQRTWGVPIPALLCKQCDYTHTSQKMIEKVAHNVEGQGIEYWDRAAITDLVPEGFTCPQCKGTEFKKEYDILDVWFDSGVSHFAVLKKNPELQFPADMYLEGKDQHRGWFQSSLLTGIVLEDSPPMRQIFTHGFTVDKNGRKMSKSLGNVVTPGELIDKLGTDGLRLWVSSIDCSGDAVVSDKLLQNVQEVFRKVRNTCRFLLSNLYDFEKKRDKVPLEKLQIIDQYALQRLFEVNYSVLESYESYDLTAVFHKLADYCTVDLSSFYLDIVKDRLYVEKADGHLRRSAQTACYYLLNTLTKLIAPILSFTAEEISDYYQKTKRESIHLQKFSRLRSIWELLIKNTSFFVGEDILSAHGPNVRAMRSGAISKVLAERDKQWNMLKNIRSVILKAMENLREQGIVKHSLEAHVTLFLDEKEPALELLNDFFEELETAGQTEVSFFKEFTIVSSFEMARTSDGLTSTSIPGVFVRVEKVSGVKCPRCWQWGVSEDKYGLCDRCQKIIDWNIKN